MAAIKKILVPTDFSENSKAVFSFVNETAKNYGAKADLIYVLSEASHHFRSMRDPLGNVFEDKDEYTRVREEFVERLRAFQKEHIDEAYRGEVFIVNEDKPAVAIADFAERNDYDLIMIASRGRGDSIFKRGSVTEKLIRISSTPVASVNKGYDPKIKKILVTTDGSQASFAVLPLALKIAEFNKATIDLLNIYEYESFAARTIGGDQGRYTIKEMQDFVLKNLTRFVENNTNRLQFVEVPLSSSEAIDLRLGNDGPAIQVSIKGEKAFSAQQAIIEYALDHAQLVMIATRGRGMISNFFIGSTTEKVARHLKMPVITLKPTKEQIAESVEE